MRLLPLAHLLGVSMHRAVEGVRAMRTPCLRTPLNRLSVATMFEFFRVTTKEVDLVVVATQHDVDGESHSITVNGRLSSVKNLVLSPLLMFTMRSSSQHWATTS